MRARTPGFTLLELIGVLTIIALLAGALAPNVVRRIDEAYYEAERADLQRIGKALRTYAFRQQGLPDGDVAAWSAALGAFLSADPGAIARNARGHDRLLIYHPNFFDSTVIFTGNWQQVSGLSSAPNAPRLMILSSLTSDVPLGAISASQFDDIWASRDSALFAESDSTLVERVNLNDAFLRLVLVNATAQVPNVQIESASDRALDAAAPPGITALDLHVLQGSRVSLHSPLPSRLAQQTVLLNRSASFSYRDYGGGAIWLSDG
ncbi:MAG: prepilin-type N-terminal cleavage/methylation domain-containing protein [Pseudomonadota bacterium]